MKEAEPESLLSEIERQQLALYTGNLGEPAPWWYFPLLGLLSGTTIATIDLKNPWVTILAVVVFSATAGGSVAFLQRRAGFKPRLAAFPHPLKTWAYVYIIGGTALVATACIYAAFVSTSSLRFTIAGAVATATTWIGGVAFERLYRRGAHRLAKG